MTAITSESSNKTDRLDERNMEFGDTFVVIFNPKEFLSRIDAAIKNLNKTYSWNLVKYYDEDSHNGDLDVFHKPLKYKHQNEFRIFVNNAENEPLILKIGSIEDISEIFEINKFRKLRFKEDKVKIEHDG